MKSSLLKLHVAIFLWGFTGVLGRAITLNEGLLVWWRMFITVVCMWVLFVLLKKVEKISLKDFLMIGGIGVILACHWLCFYGSIKYANVSIALTCLSASGFVSAILEPMFFKRKINPKELLFGLFTVVGIFLVYKGNVHFSVGIYIGLAATVLTVLVSILNKKLVDNYKPETLTIYQLTGGFVGLSILMPFYNHFFPTDRFLPTHSDWVWLIILALVCTIFTFILYTQALKHLSAFTMNLTLTLEPVYGIVLAFLIYQENEDLSSTFYIGFVLIIAAVILQTRSITKKPRIIVPRE